TTMSLGNELRRLTEIDRAEFRSQFLIRFPEADDLFVAWDVAWETIAHFLGVDWARRHLMPSGGNPYFLMEAQDDSLAAYLRQHRLITLGNRLFELQDVPGFWEMT